MQYRVSMVQATVVEDSTHAGDVAAGKLIEWWQGRVMICALGGDLTVWDRTQQCVYINHVVMV